MESRAQVATLTNLGIGWHRERRISYEVNEKPLEVSNQEESLLKLVTAQSHTHFYQWIQSCWTNSILGIGFDINIFEVIHILEPTEWSCISEAQNTLLLLSNEILWTHETEGGKCTFEGL